jgi:eukaryotic-like serine/threonine-protein kinase
MPDYKHWENLKEIFHAAVGLTPDARTAYLDRACEGDDSLRQAVESLLKSHEETGFVDQPAYQAAGEMFLQDRKLTAGQTIGRYRIVSLIGEGGMGQVYLAEDTKLHRKVSLKFLSTNFGQDQERMRRFEQEARAASALNHQNILTIHEIGEADGHRFIATEFIEGQTLRERLRVGLDIHEALEIAIQVASALVAAHRVNIVHRDIKPENIMIRKDDGLVKVLDFGLAKVSRPKVAYSVIDREAQTQFLANTTPGVVVGTAAYMSPEQARGDPVDERTDIWSLGVVLYEMIAGCSPFVAGTSNEIISAILSKEALAPLTRYSHVVPERLEEIVEKALTKNREERYQSSKDLLIDLKRLQHTLQLKSAAPPDRIVAATADGQAVVSQSDTSAASAQTASSAEYIVNQIRSHKREALTGFAVLLLIVAAAFIYVWRIRQIAAPAQPEIKSLAVLPLRSLDIEDNYLGLGIADAVIRRISQTGKVIVRPTSAVRRYLSEETDALSAAKQLGVDSVLEGTVQLANEQLRISVNLLRVTDGASLWADRFDMRTADIFTIQDTISQQVASRLQLKLDPAQEAHLGKRYTSNPEAYEYYVKGRTNLEGITTSIGDRKAIDAAIAYFKRAIEVDPKYALAYARLGYAYLWLANFNDPDNPVWIGLAQQALSRAESLDPQLAETHSARFEYYFSKYGRWDLAQAAREARQAVALDPSVGHMELGTIYDHLGLDEATGLREFQRAAEIDPTNTFVQGRLAESFKLYGRFNESNEINRRYFGESYAPALVGMGQFDEAESLLETSVKKNAGDLVSRSYLALVLALKGQRQNAEAAIPAILQQARNNRAYHHITYNIACVNALEGKTDEAVKWLQMTAETGMPNYPLFVRDPHLNRIRKETAFIQFMAELQPRWEGLKKAFE